MSDIKMSVVNSTVGLGETEYSLCDNKGMLKYDKPALDECCEIINSNDTMQARITELESLIKEADDYLNTNKLTTICNGSILHAAFKEAIKDEKGS